MKCRHQERVKRTVTRSPVLDEKIEEYQPHWSSPEIAQKLSQGARREQVSIGSKQYPIDVIDIPGEVTAYPADPVPVVWFPGFASTSLTFASNMARMSERGRRTISVYCPHGVPVPKEHDDNVAQMRQAVAIVETLKHMGVSEIDAVAHSQGAVIVAMAAMIEPGLFRTITVSSPAGMTGGDSFFGLMSRAKESKKEEKELMESDTYTHKETFKELNKIREAEKTHYLFDDMSSIGHSFSEVRSLSSVQIHEMLRTLQADYNIPVGFIHGDNDELMPIEKVLQYVRMSGIPEEHMAIMPNAGHSLHAEYPDEFTDIAYTMIQTLRRKRQAAPYALAA